jgi:hypothetical protein
MKRRLVFGVLAAVLLSGGAVSYAQMPADDTIPVPVPVPQLMKVSAPKLFHVSLNYSMGLNIKGTFQNLGGLANSPNPGPATGGVNHHYDDGYVDVDVTGNNHGGFQGTWNWGYQNAGQISGGNLLMHGSSWGSGGSSTANTDGPAPGMELIFGRELGRAKHARWGLDGTFGFTDVRIQDSSPVNAQQTLITDSYNLGGVIPPAPPYHGTVGGPGPIITDTPNRTTSAGTPAVITGPRELNAQLYSFKVGPYAEVPLSERLALQFRGGLALVEVVSQFSYNETTSIVVPGTGPPSANGSHNGLQVGGYAAANIAFAFNDSASIFAGGQFQDVGEYTQNLNGRKAVLNLTRSIFVAIGFSYSY